MLRNPKVLRVCALFLLIQFTSQTLFVPFAFALTSGPGQPEFSSFEPVATTNMVNEFTGDFTYNLPVIEVPGPQGSSYPLSLSYHSGVGPEEEASWVGYGWTLNPGAINRNLRGLPDDYNGQSIIHHNKMPKNWTGTVGTRIGFGEIFGIDLQKIAGANLSLGVSLRYNNYRGFGYNAGIGLSLGKGLVSMGYNVSDGTGSYSLGVNPSAILSWNKLQSGKELKYAEKRYNTKFIEKDEERLKGDERTRVTSSMMHGSLSEAFQFGSSYGIFSYAESSHPNIVHPYTGNSFNVTVAVEGNPVIVPVGATLNLSGSYAYQKNIESRSLPSFGYLYSAEAQVTGAPNESAMDYHVEYEKDFNKRDVFLGVPFNDADNFMVSGEGLGGGFRLYNKTAGQFTPTYTESNTTIYNVGGEIGAGWTFGPGVDLGVGLHKLTVSHWKKEISNFQRTGDTNVDEPVFFRFNNDMGGEWGTNHDDKPFYVNLSGHSISLPSLKDKYSASDERSGRSSFIGYNTNLQMHSGSVPTDQAFSKNEKLIVQADRSNPTKEGLIGELAVFNEQGNRYVYGLPVYAKEEKRLSYSPKGASFIDQNYLWYGNSPNADVKVGEEKNDPYATSYLLTEITTSDYLDAGVTGGKGENGPSMDDLGGYTRFNYSKAQSDFIWRAPFKGGIYQKNSQSDPLDDMVSYSEGKKEIYYLKSIETKTHIAVFNTEDREDGMEASANAWPQNTHPDGNTKKLKRLKSIDLFLISDCQRDGENLARYDDGSPKTGTARPIKTVYFQYDYSLCKQLPNSTSNAGKLTLKGIYTEYNGIHETRISPYLFGYEYPTENDYEKFPDQYKQGGVNDVSNDYITGPLLKPEEQNPNFSNFFTDAWGNYQVNGEERFSNVRPWLNQDDVSKTDPLANHFDPAAWHLKKITLPSGGQILVQYEQDDYSYVQDQEAHVMAPLKYEPADNRYVIDIDKIGLAPGDVTELQKMITKRFVGPTAKKIYFKFLYSLVGDNMPDLGTCNGEFISGYANVSSCAIESGNLVIYLVPGLDQNPTKVCKDFVKAQRLGKVDPGASCDPGRGISDPDDAEALVNQLLSMAAGIAVEDQYLCQHVNQDYSYLRIPTLKAKKGGGIRVKRLLMFDEGIEGNPVLYGSEYIYKTRERSTNRIISSGVATNEPQIIREENVLVDFIQRKGQDLWSRIVAGKDRDQAEGPLGESIMPGPSVGYSKVIVKNIYSGKKDAGSQEMDQGFSISEFHTAYSDPIALAIPGKEETMTSIKRNDDNPIPISMPFFTYVKTKTSAVQGFSFVLNNMHGQPLSTTSYSGSYSSVNTHDFSNAKEVNRIVYDYYKPGERVPMMSSLYEGVKLKNPGREVDITFAQRSVEELSDDINVEVDLQLTIIPLAFVVLVIPYPTGTPSYAHIEGELNTHTTTKVVRYPTIVRKTTITQNGITHEEENIAFDDFTGRPVAVRSTDEFKGAYLAQSIPASWEYSEMGGKWKNQGKIISGSFTLTGEYLSLGTDPCNLAVFTRGDEIQMTTAAGDKFYHVIERDYINNRLKVQPAKGTALSSGDVTKIKVIHSGKANQLTQQAGAITMHDEVKDNLKPPVADITNRYSDGNTNDGHDNFATELKAATQSLSGEGQFTLTGPYTQLDMSAFADKLDGCNVDLTNATVTEMTFTYVVEDTQVSVQLMQFKIQCSGSTVTVKAEGW